MSFKNAKGPYKYDDDDDYVPMKKVKYSLGDEVCSNTKKHTLDSDEEDEGEEQKESKKRLEELNDEDIDGQEEATIAFEGETEITPFNMKEEMEEGHFDKDGFYHFKKDADALKDAWLEDVDWIKIKREGEDLNKYGSDVESESSDEDLLPKGTDLKAEKKAEIALYKDMRELIKPEETVAKALKRLGGATKRLSSAERWKLKKQGKLESATNLTDFNTLTELTNQIVEQGNMDVYQETFEMINLKIKRFESSEAKTSDPMDMFSDGLATSGSATAADDDSQQKDTFDEVKWEYRWKNEDDSEVHGPFPTDKMIRWKESNFFKDGAYVRKVSEAAGPWYHASRVDFELYV